jgi:hypothetical protein
MAETRKRFKIKACFSIICLISLLGCTASVPIIEAPLKVPYSPDSQYLKAYNRFIVPGNSTRWISTKINIEINDIILVLASSIGSAKYPASHNFQIKIGNGSHRSPLSSNSNALNYGYFMPDRAGEIKFRIRSANSGGDYKVDIIAFQEKFEPKLFDWLTSIKNLNSDDELLQSQIENFMLHYHWIGYTDLAVNSSPSYAEVLLDGAFQGITPLTIYDIEKYKRYEICIRIKEYSEYCEEFTPAEKSSFKVTLNEKVKEDGIEEETTFKPEKFVTKDKLPPTIEVLKPQLSENQTVWKTQDYSHKILGVAKDESGIVWVRINGELTNLDTNGTFWYSVNLAVGENQFEIEAIDTKNNLAAKTIIIERSPVRITKKNKDLVISNPKNNLNFGNYYALVVGINNYKFLPKLKTAINDANTVASVLEQNYGFEIKLLIDAKRSDLLLSLGKFRNILTKQDNLLIYYAGHGWLDKAGDEGYWLPVDAEIDNTINWVSNYSITTTLKAMEAKHVLIIADSCYSGKLARGLHVVQKTPSYISRLSQRRARCVISSGGLEPVIDDGGKGLHSVFASALLDALKENTGIMDSGQLFYKLRRPVLLNSDQTPEYSDIRKAGHEGGEFIFVRK